MPVDRRYELRPAPPATAYPVELEPALGETFAAGMRQSNEIAALGALMSRPGFTPDPNFDLKVRAAEVPEIFENYRDSFVGTVSDADFDYRVGKIRKELDDRRKLQASGIAGVLAEVGAGLLSPTTLIPIVGLSAKLGLAGRAAVVAANAAGAAAVDEAILRSANLTRTDLETALNIGGSAFLGAALGAVFGKIPDSLRGQSVERIERAILDPDRRMAPEEQEEFLAQVAPSSVGAAAVDTVRYAGPVEGIGRFGRALSEMSPAVAPTTRAQTSEYPLESAAAFQQQFTTGGLRITPQVDPDSSLGMLQAVGEGGPLEGISRAQERAFDARIVDAVMEAWIKHDEIKSRFFRRFEAEATSLLSGTRLRPAKPGKLTFREFNEELTRALHMGDESPYPEIAAAAKEIRKNVIEPITEAAQRVGLLPRELTQDMLKGANSYFMRVYDHEILRRHPNAFMEILIQHSDEKLQDYWRQKLMEIKEKNAEDMQAVADRTMDPERAAENLKEIKQELADVSTGSAAQTLKEIGDIQRQALRLMKEAKELRLAGQRGKAYDLEVEARRLREQARRLREMHPEAEELKKYKRRLEKRRKQLRRSLDGLIGQQEKAMDQADRLAQLMDDSLFQTAPRIKKLIDDLDKLTDESFEEKLRKLSEEFKRVENQIERGEAALERLARKFPELVDAPAEWEARAQRFKQHVFQESQYVRGPKGERRLVIDSEESRKAALEAIDAVLDEGEVKIRVTDNPAMKARIDAGDRITEEFIFEPLTEQQIKSLKAWRDQIAALEWSDAEALAKAEIRFNREIAWQVARQERFDRALEKLRAAEAVDPDQVRAVALARLEDLVRATTTTMKKRALREQMLREKAERIGFEKIPEWYEETERLREAPRNRVEKFLDAVREAGADDVDIEAGVFDFRKSLREKAAEILSKIQGNVVRTPIDGELLLNERGPALARLLDVPYDRKFSTPEGEFAISDFLVKDVAQVARTYARTMVPDIVLTQRFGNPSASKWLDPTEGLLRKEYALRAEQIAKDLDRNNQPLARKRTAQEKEELEKQLSRDLHYAQMAAKTLVERLKHVHGVPEDPTGAWTRTARAWRAAQVPLYMGNVAFSSLPELFRPWMRYGVLSTFRDSWSRLVTDFRGFMREVEEAQKAGQALDTKLNTRLMAFADIAESNIRHTPLEKFIEFLAAKTGAVALFDGMTTILKSLAAPVVHGYFWRALEKVMDPNTTEPTVRAFSRDEALKILANAGVSERIAFRMWDQVQKHGFVRSNSGFIHPNFDEWDDVEVLNSWRGWLGQELDTVITTPGLERPMWTTVNEVARIVNQFRSFMWASTTKVLLAALQKRDMDVVLGYIAMMGAAYLSYAGWAAQHGPGTPQWEEFMQADAAKIADEVIYRSGVLASLGEAKDILAEVSYLRPYLTFSGEGASKLKDPNPFEAALGVSMSTARKVLTVLKGLDDPSRSTTKAMRQLMPYNNVWYLRRAFMEIEDAAADAAGIPEKRARGNI